MKEKHVKEFETLSEMDHRTIFLAMKQHSIVGYLLIVQGQLNRNRHSAYFAMGVLKKYQGQGIGQSCFEMEKNGQKNEV